MSPPRYQRGYSFSGFQANLPGDPLPGTRLDIELDDIAYDLKRFSGASAYDLAVLRGFEGDVDVWLASLVGPQGPKGDGDTSGNVLDLFRAALAERPFLQDAGSTPASGWYRDGDATGWRPIFIT